MELSQVLQALRNADAAGDTEAAKRLAEIAKQLMAEGMPATAKPEAAPQSGGIAALKSGASKLKSDVATLLGRTGIIEPTTAERVIEEEKKYQAQTFRPTEKGWTEAPLTKFAELLGGSAPYMAAPLAAGVAAATLPVSGPAATALGAGAAGLASFGQFTGSFLSRQMETGKKLGETELGTAALAALPAAALDTISLRMIPGIRNLLAAAGREVTEAEAKAIAQQGLGRTFGDYVAKSGKVAGVEGLTESAQQVLERLQAGLSITDKEARDEYIDNFIGGAVLGGTLAVPGRAVERGRIKTKAEEIEREEKKAARAAAVQAKEAEAAAEEARKQDPQYMRDVVAESQALEQEKRALMAQIQRAPKGEMLTEEQKQANKEIQLKLKELAPKLERAAKESNRVKPLLAKIEEQARLAGMSPEEFMLEQMQPGEGLQVPKGGRFETRPEEEPAAPDQVQAYIQQQTDAAREAGALTLQDRVDYLMRDPLMAAQIVKTRTPMPDLAKKDNKVLFDALELQLKELDKQRIAAGRAATGAAQERLGTVEAEEQAALEEAQRQQAALDAETARERKIAPEILAQRRIAAQPVFNFGALEGAAPEPGGTSVMGRTAQELQGLPIGAEGQPIYTAEEEKAPPPAPVPKRVKGEFRLFNQRGEPQRPSDYNNLSQRLASALARKDIDQDAYEFLRRAENVLPQYDQKIEIARETYTPVGKDGKPGVAPPYQKDLTETEGFLTLLDRQLERIEKGEEGILPAGARRQIEVPAAPLAATEQRARAEAATPTMADLRDIQQNATADPRTLTALQRKRVAAFTRYINEGKSPAQAAGYAYRDSIIEQPEGERVAAEPRKVRVGERETAITPRTLRGPSAAVAPLSFAQELEPMLRAAEQVAGADIAETTQIPLFEEEQAKLGIAFKTPEEFAAFLGSDEANRMRGELVLANKELAQLGRLPELQQRVKELTARVERLVATQKTIKDLKALTLNRNAILQASQQATKLNEAITKFVVGRMSLGARIEALTADKERLTDLLKESSLPAMRVKGKVASAVTQTQNLRKELSNVLARLESAQDVMTRTETGAKRAQTMLRVLAAENKMAEIMQVGSEAATVAMFPESVIENARKDLQAAIAELEPVQKKEAEQRLEAMVKAGEARRAAAAVDRVKAEEARNEARKEEQRRLEERFADSVDRQQITAVDQAQRDARDLGAPTFQLVELNGLEKDPVQVLGGYRSAITALESQLRKAQERSKQARMSQLDGLKKSVDALEAQYKAAKAADARAALLPKIEAATADYAAQADKLNAQPLTWKGMASQIKTLADLYNKVDFLEAKIGPNGEFAASVLEDKEQFRALLNKEARAERAKVKREQKAAAKKAAAQAEAAEAASRASAPATTGEALTRTEATQARKQKKTVFGTAAGSAAEATAKQAADIQARAVAERTVIEAKAKQARGEKLTELEKGILAQAKAAAKTRPVYRTATTGGEGVDYDKLNRMVTEIVKDWKNVPTIITVETFDDLPANIKAQAIADNMQDVLPGLYNPGNNTVYLVAKHLHSKEDVIATVAHEVAGHYGLRSMLGGDYAKTMNSIYDGNTAVRKKADAKIAEMPSLTREVAVEEVLAEMAEVAPAQQTAQEKSALRKVYDVIKAWFQKTFGDKVSDAAVQQIVANARHYVIQGGIDRTAQAGGTTPVYRSVKPKYESENALTELADKVIAQPKTFKERMGSNLALEAEMNAVDMRAALQEALKRGAKELGKDDLFTQAMYNVRKADQFMPLVYTTLSNGPLETYTDEKGLRGIRSSNTESAVDVIEATKDIPAGNSAAKFALATTYMVAQRAANKGLSKLDLGELGLTEADLAAAMDAANADPELKAALENVRAVYNAYNAGLIKFLADMGAISKATAKEWLKDGDYVPYYRVREDGTAELVLGGEKTLTVGDIRTQPYLAELKGGDTKILPLNESIIRNTMLITKAALYNNATKEVAYAMQEFGVGKGKIDEETGKPKNSMPIHKGQGPAGNNIIRFRQEPDPKDPEDDGKRWLRIKTEGTAMEGIPSELVVKSLEGAHLTLPAFLKIGGIAGDWLRKGVTRMPPYIFRQLIRDPMAASFTGGLNYGPFRAVVMAGTEFLRSSAGQSEKAKNLIEKGLVQSGIFTGDPDDMSAFATQLASGKDGPAIDRLFGLLDRAAMRADAATRALVYENAIKNGLSEVEADMMTMESMNFYKRGLSPTVQYANRLYPFFNAQIQGLNVLAKAMRGNMPFEERQKIQRKFWNNAVLLFGVGLAYAMAMEDDETFKNAKPRDKYTNFFVHLPGVSEAVKIPLPYESGWFFAAAVALADAMKAETDGGQQLKALRDMFLSSVPGYTSGFMPQAAKPLYEVFTNKNYFSGQNIESVAMQNRSPEERYTAATTEAAKAMGKVLPFSPVQIEHLTRGYFGTAPLALMSVASTFMRGPEKGEAPERRLSETPVFGTMFQRKFGGADADALYQYAKEATQRAGSLNELKKTGTPEEYRAYVAEHRTQLAMAPAARKFEMMLGRLRTQEDLIRNRKDMNSEEKRARLDQIDKIRQDLAEKFNAAVRKTESRAAS